MKLKKLTARTERVISDKKIQIRAWGALGVTIEAHDFENFNHTYMMTFSKEELVQMLNLITAREAEIRTHERMLRVGKLMEDFNNRRRK